MSLCSVPISILCVIVKSTLSLGLLLSLSHDYCYNNCEHGGNEDCYCDEDGAAACSLGILFFHSRIRSAAAFCKAWSLEVLDVESAPPRKKLRHD